MQVRNFQVDHPEHFESDRECLPFPRGGVFGRHDEHPTDDVASTPDVIANVNRLLDRAQCHMDALATDVQSLLHMPEARDDDEPDLDPAA